MKKSVSKKIFVAPNFFNNIDYFDNFNKFFKSWKVKEIKKIEKKYGKECMIRIAKSEIPISEGEDKKMRSTLRGKKLKAWNENEMQCFLAYIELHDLSMKHKTFYHSFLIYIVAELEDNLDDICNQYAKLYKKDITLKDVSGRGIERSMKYLKLIAGLKLPHENLTKEILLMRDVRNCIAHAGGKLNKPELMKKFKINKFIQVADDDYSENKFLLFNDKYCKHALKIVDRYLMSLAKNNSHVLWHFSLGAKGLT